MRRIIIFTLLTLTLLGGVAAADRDHRSRGRDNDRGYRNDRRGHVVRDHRYRGGYDRPRRHNHSYSHYRPVRWNNGYYNFHNGYRYRYARPVIHHRYYDYRVRPQIVVENYENVPGYIWIAGQWTWNGSEWTWVSGRYELDQNYYNQNPGYYDQQNQGYYDQQNQGYYNQSEY